MKTIILSMIILVFSQTGNSNNNMLHILFMVVDDLGSTDISHNNAEYETQNIDSLISTGIELKNYYIQIDCTPTRSALLTGQYAFKLGLQYIMPIPPESTTYTI